MTPRALRAVTAIEDLLVGWYRVRSEAAGERRPASLATPAGAAVWGAYVNAHLPSAEVNAEISPLSARRRRDPTSSWAPR